MATENININVNGLNDIQRAARATQALANNLNGEAAAFTNAARAARRQSTALNTSTTSTNNASKAQTLLTRSVILIDGPLGGFASRANQTRLILNDLGISGSTVALVLTGLALGALATVAAFGAFVASGLRVVDQQTKTARALDITNESLVTLQFAAAQFAGLTSTQLNTALGRMERVLGDVNLQTNAVGDSLQLLGVNIVELQAQKPEEQFRILAGAISQVGNASTRASIAQSIFGRNGRQLQLVLREGERGLLRYRAEAESLGLVLRTDLRMDIEGANDAIDSAARAFQGLGNTLAALSAGVITTFARGLEGITSGLGRIIRDIFDLESATEIVGQTRSAFGGLFGAVRDLGRTLRGQGGFLDSYASGISKITDQTSTAEQITRRLLVQIPSEAGAFLRVIERNIQVLTRQLLLVMGNSVQFRDLTRIIERLTTVKSSLQKQVELNNQASEEQVKSTELTSSEFKQASVEVTRLDGVLKRLNTEVGRSRIGTLASQLDRNNINEGTQLLREQGIVRRNLLRQRLIDTTMTESQIARATENMQAVELTRLQTLLARQLEANVQVGKLIVEDRTRTQNAVDALVTQSIQKRQEAEMNFAIFQGNLNAEIVQDSGANNFATQEEMLRQSLIRRMEILNEFRSSGVISEEQYQLALNQVRIRAAQQSEEIDRARNRAGISLAGNFFGNLATIFETASGKQTAASRAAAQTENAINTYLAATKAFQALAGIPIVGPVLGGVAAGAAIAAGVQNSRRIASAGRGGVTGGSAPRVPTTRGGAFGGPGRNGSVGFRTIGSGSDGASSGATSIGSINVSVDNQGATQQDMERTAAFVTQSVNEAVSAGNAQTFSAVMDEFRANGSLDRT